MMTLPIIASSFVLVIVRFAGATTRFSQNYTDTRQLSSSRPLPVPCPSALEKERVCYTNLNVPGRHLHRSDGCISSVLCCGKAGQKTLEGFGDTSRRILKTGNPYKLQTGNYMEAFARHLKQWFAETGVSRNVTGIHESRRSRYKDHLLRRKNKQNNRIRGRFLDVGGTGDTRAGMTQSQGKFAQFTGEGLLEYWITDIDPAAGALPRAVVCDLSEDCPQLPTESFDVVFSHVVLEHVRKPWHAVNTIHRVTKPRGLSMHVVPFLHRFETLLPHYFHFTHQGIASLFQDRGFTVLEVGYDFCEHKVPERRSQQGESEMPNTQIKDNWLVYIIAQK